MPSIIDDDLIVRGRIQADDMTVPFNAVGDAEFNGDSPLTVDKQEHRVYRTFGQSHGTAAVAQRQVIHVANATGTLEFFRVGLTVACIGDSTITINLLKNGVSVLSSTLVLDNTNTAFTGKEDGTFSSTTVAAGDVFEVQITVNAGTGTLGQGVFALLILKEAAA